MKLEINQFIANGGTIFGICLGLQILFDHSMESDTDTLGLLNGQVVPVEQDYNIGLNVGFHKLELSEYLDKNSNFSKLFSKKLISIIGFIFYISFIASQQIKIFHF